MYRFMFLTLLIFTANQSLANDPKPLSEKEATELSHCVNLEYKTFRDIKASVACSGLAAKQSVWSEHQRKLTTAIPSGAIFLYAPEADDGTPDRTSPFEPCPEGWKFMQATAGRFPIGAGQPNVWNNDTTWAEKFNTYEIFNHYTGKNDKIKLRPYLQDSNDKWLYYRLMDAGGAETVTLNEAQMPAHRHSITSSPPGEDIHDGFGGSGEKWGLSPEYDSSKPPQNGWSVTQHTSFMSIKGSSKPHNNMPPYIALYFCKKD